MRNSMNLKAFIDGVPVNEMASIGDDVCVTNKGGKRSGIVKIPDGPGDTVGVLIDGTLEMVPEDDLQIEEPKEDCADDDADCDEAISESVIGMVAMPSLARMQELAGIRLSEDVPAFLKKKDEDEPEADADAEADAEDGTEEGTEDADYGDTEEVEADAGPEVAANHPATAGEVTMMSAPATETDMAPDEVVEEVEESPAQICMDAITKIEASLPQVSIAQFSEIRRRIEAVMVFLLEGVEGRGRKL